MFEVNGVYANRKGEYTVLALNPPVMQVRYTDGTEAELKIALQERIWENIAAEYEAKAASKSAKRRAPIGTNHYIKTVSITPGEDLIFPGWAERVVMGPQREGIEVKPGDRVIIYVLESKMFIAVATITGEPKSGDPKDYFYTVPFEEAAFYPIDIDAEVTKIENGVDVDTIELESQPNFKRLRMEVESFLAINEDDFELLAEALTEMSEEEEEEIDEDDIDLDEDE